MTEAGYLNYEAKAGITLTGNEITAYGGSDVFGYLDSTRSVGKYYQTVLSATVSDNGAIYDDYGVAFLVAARTQLSRSNWNTAYTAAEINTWIRAGFNIGSDPPASPTIYLISAGGSTYIFQTGA